MFGPLRTRIEQSVEKLREQIVAGEEAGAPENELEQAKTVLAQAMVEQNGTSA